MKKSDILKNDTICPLPFKHAYVGPTYERKLCCISEGEIDKFRGKPLDEFWNSEEMKKIRLDMIQGNKNKMCEPCYYKEKSGIPSYRQNELLHEKNRNNHDWLTEEVFFEGTVEIPANFDYRTIHCNLTCNHCGPNYSSEHLRLRDKRNSAGLVESNGKSFKIDKTFEESMLKDLIQAVDERRLERVYFAGGEPMMSPFHWKFIEHLKHVHDNEDEDFVQKINLYYNTNLTKSTWKGENVYEYLKFLNPIIHASLDGVGSTFNFVRAGADWEIVKNNFDYAHNNLASIYCGNYTFGIQPVILSHNIFSIDEFLSFFEQYPNIMMQPMPLMRMFPEKAISYYNAYPGFLDPIEFPEEIMIPAINRAIERVKSSTLKGAEKCLPILENYKEEIKIHRKNAEELEIWSYASTKVMEEFSNVSLNSLLKEINTEAWIWYNGLCHKYKDIDLKKYKMSDTLVME